MFKKEQIIDGMCMTYRHDFGLLGESEKHGIRCLMVQIFEHNFLPVLKDIHDDADCGCKQCMHVVVQTTKDAMGI